MTAILNANETITRAAFGALTSAGFFYCREMRRFESEQGVNGAEADQVLALVSFQRKTKTVRFGVEDLRSRSGLSMTTGVLALDGATVESLLVAAKAATEAARTQALPSWARTDGISETLDAEGA